MRDCTQALIEPLCIRVPLNYAEAHGLVPVGQDPLGGRTHQLRASSTSLEIRIHVEGLEPRFARVLEKREREPDDLAERDLRDKKDGVRRRARSPDVLELRLSIQKRTQRITGDQRSIRFGPVANLDGGDSLEVTLRRVADGQDVNCRPSNLPFERQSSMYWK